MIEAVAAWMQQLYEALAAAGQVSLFQESVLHGSLLMVAYALGRGLVLLAVATSVGFLKALNIGRTSRYIEYLSGAVVLAASVGLLVFYDDFVRFTMQLMPAGQ